MKIKSVRICARKGCANEFKMFRTTDKFCSAFCAFQSKKSKPLKKQKPLKPYSEKRRKEGYIYNKKRLTFLLKPENKFCPVAKLIYNENILCSEVHHKKGRKGKLLNYVPFWLAVSRKGHLWIHANPNKAYKLNFLIRSTTI